jgi:hypothetical protein
MPYIFRPNGNIYVSLIKFRGEIENTGAILTFFSWGVNIGRKKAVGIGEWEVELLKNSLYIQYVNTLKRWGSDPHRFNVLNYAAFFFRKIPSSCLNPSR